MMDESGDARKTATRATSAGLRRVERGVGKASGSSTPVGFHLSWANHVHIDVVVDDFACQCLSQTNHAEF